MLEGSAPRPSAARGRGLGFLAARASAASALLIFGGTVILLVACFLLQLRLTSLPGDINIPTFRWLLGLGFLAGMLLSWRQAADEPWVAATVASTRLPRSSYVLAGIALLCALAGAWLVHSQGSPTEATIAWALGLAMVVGAVARVDAPRHLLTRVRSAPWTALLVVAIVVGAAALRLVAIDTVPGYIHNDEASNGLMARSVAEGQVSSLFSYGWASLPILGYAWDAMFFKLFGDSLASLRDSSAVLGIASIAVVALLGKELFSPRAGVLAAALLSVYHVHLHFSRVGHHYIQALFAVTLTLYLLVLFLRYGSRLAAVGAGIMISVDVQAYFAARVAYVIVPLAVAYVLLISDRAAFRSRLAGLGWMVVGLIVGVAPIGALILGDWSDFTARTRAVLVLGGLPDTQGHVYGSYGTRDAVYILRTQAWRILQAFNFLRDSSEQYGIGHPLLDPVSGALLPAAVAYAIFRIRRPGFAICLIGLVSAAVVGGIATIDPPFWPRLIVIVPFMALLVAALLDELWRVADGVTALRWAAWPAALVVLVAIAYGNFRWYFAEYAPSIHDQFIAVPMDIGSYLRPIHDNPSVYGISAGSLDVTHQAVQLLAPDVKDACNIPSGVDVRQCPFPPGRDRIFFIGPDRAALLPQLRATYPGGTLRVLRTYDQGAQVWVYRVRG
jgi:4-amino-4-deoxy-L-arabinose transferase-like glycosyltransferase